jgi:hypothetical protein
VDLGIARDLDQLHGALGPFPDRLDPERRAALEALFVILKRRIIALALHQAETLRVAIDKGRDLQGLRILERPPQPLALTIEHL